MIFPFLLCTNKVKLNTSQNNNVHTYLQLQIWLISPVQYGTINDGRCSAQQLVGNQGAIWCRRVAPCREGRDVSGEVGLITPRVNLFSCSLSWNCFVFDRRSAWAGLMLLATGSHSQQRCSTTKGVKIKQWKRGSHACCCCIIALLSSVHFCSGYSLNLTHAANYALTWSTKVVHYRYSNFNTACLLYTSPSPRD